MVKLNAEIHEQCDVEAASTRSSSQDRLPSVRRYSAPEKISDFDKRIVCAFF